MSSENKINGRDDLENLEDFYQYLGIPSEIQGSSPKQIDILKTFKNILSKSDLDLAIDVEACKHLMLDAIELVQLQEDGIAIQAKSGCTTCSGCGSH